MLFMYPAIFHEEEGQYWVEFPDLEGCQTFGDSLSETMRMAQEAMEGYIITTLEMKQPLNPPSDIKKVVAAENAFVSLVATEIKDYTKNTKSVKKTLTIPEWMDDMAQSEGINFSQTLQNALMEQFQSRV